MIKRPYIIFFLVFFIFVVFKSRRRGDVVLVGSYSLRSSCKLRDAPYLQAPFTWQLNLENWPLHVVEVKNNWVLIEDSLSTRGWIQKKFLSTKKYAVCMQDCRAYFNDAEYAHIKKGAILKLSQVSREKLCVLINKKICIVDRSCFWV